MSDSGITPTIKTVKATVPRVAIHHCEFSVYHRALALVKIAKEVTTSNGEKSVGLLRRLLKMSEMKVTELEEMTRLLKEVLFQSDVNVKTNSKTTDKRGLFWKEINKCESDDIESEKTKTKMFSSGMVYCWGEDKTKMKQLMTVHRKIVKQLQTAQKRCWLTRGKVVQYKQLIEDEVDALEQNPGDKDKRKTAINDLDDELYKWQYFHRKNVNRYKDLVEQENLIKAGLKHVTNMLETDITTSIQRDMDKFITDISTACNRDPKILKDADPIMLSNGLYESASKHYVYAEEMPEVESPEFFVPIPTPVLEDSPYKTSLYSTQHEQKGTERPRGKAACFTVITDTHNKNNQQYLKLKRGQLVKQKCVSSDGLTAFGWTRKSLLCKKRWGFFPTHAVQNLTTV